MSSSILAGERRWVPGPARRGGMTVLGKVVVPKPLNLPSQRLENHGLDPNVEIVPKGSLSWGSRSSSSASNPWGSSALSPNADGAGGSPSHLSGRPSSGSGTRPSTAGSDKKSEPTAIAWGPNSRPSSASGASTGNQTSHTPLRPRSADTRPGSSPLSRFAEPSSDNAGAWGSTGTVDKLVVASSKNDGFSLSSGDFPTLGSDKDNFGKNSESQDHGSHSRPGSSSGRVVHAREIAISPQADVSSGNVNAWKRDGSPHVDDVVHPKADKWQGDPQQYMNPNMPPQQFDSWHGPPMNAPGVWYGGPPGGPPYPPVAHGRFPMEPFPYYRPQFSAPPSMVNSQSVPHPGAAGPRGHHPQNVDLYRPHAPDAYIRPGMPIRPGFFPGPVAYESYYGPPMGYNEKDMPFMGMAGGPPVHGRYLAQNTPDGGNNHARSGGRGPAVKQFVPEQVDSGHPEEPRGPYKVLMKQHNEWGGKAEEDNWEQFEKGDHPRRVLQKNEWGTDNRRDEELFSRMTPGENLPKQGGLAVKSVEGKDNAKVVDDGAGRKSEVAAISSQEVPRPRPTTPKDPTLIQKIEGLNAKARGTDGRQDAAWGSGREEQKNRLHVDAKASNSTNEVSAQTMKDYIPAKSTAVPRRSYNVTESRVDDRGKARVNNQDADAWRKKHQVADPSRSVPAANFGHGSRVIALDHPTPLETDEKSEIDLPRKDEEGMFDPNDCHAQRVKMRELAKQRAIQLQKEEEERIKEQKAKALAKLEELNRRTKAADGSTHKLEKAPPSDAPQHEQVVLPVDEQLLPNTKEEPLSSDLAPKHNFSAHISDKCSSGVVESTVLPRDTNLETPKNAETPAILHGRSLPLKPDVRNSTVADTAAPPQVTDANVLKQKRMGYKQKQNNTQVEKQNNTQVEKQNHAQVEKNTTQNVIEVGRIEVPKGHCSTAVNAVEFIKVVPSEIVASSEPSLPDGSQVMPESSSNQRKKNNRSSKSKPKLDDTSHLPASQQQAPNESNPVKASKGKPKVAPDQSVLDTISVQQVTGTKDLPVRTKDLPVQSSELQAPLPSEEAHGRGNHQLKPQQSRRVQRNQQAVRPAGNGEAVVWAPVRSQNKMETMDEATPKNAAEMVVTTAAGKSDELGQSNVKSKRAEMERYVPKLAAKEQLSQQGSAQQQPMQSSITPTGRAESSFQVKTGGSSDLEAKNGDNKQMKQQHQGKFHGAWRQRGSVESSRVQGSSLAPHSGKNVQKFMDQHESSEPVTEPVREEQQQLQQPMAAGEWNDGWHMPDEPPPVVAASVTSSVKDQGAVAGRGKRYPQKGQRNNQDLDQRNSVGWENEINEQDTVLASKENRGTGEQKPTQWQAKPHGNYQRGGRSSGTKKDFPPLQQDKESNVPTQFVSENKYAGKAPNVGEHQDGRRERKTVGSSKGRPQSPNVGFVEGATEEAFSSNQTGQQQFLSGFRKNGNQNNNRSVRGHESRGEWSSGGQDNKPHNMPPPNRESRRQNAHYEYQPVGSYNNNKSNNFDGPRDGSRNFGSRYRERSMGQDGRNSYGGQQSGTVQADSGNDWQE